MEQTDSKEIKNVPIRFRIPNKLPSVIGQHIIIQPNEDGVLLSFYEIIPPIISHETYEEQITQLKEIGVIAECVSKVFVPNSKYVEFVQAMKSILPDEDFEVSKINDPKQED